MSWKLPDSALSLRGPASVSIDPGGFDLPSRLFELLKALPRRRRLLDVGADHGLLALAALRLGIVEEAFAIDRREGPLAGAAARGYLAKNDRYQFVLSDGLKGVETAGDDVVVIAGMSGENASCILRDVLSRGERLPALWAFQVNLDLRFDLRSVCPFAANEKSEKGVLIGGDSPFMTGPFYLGLFYGSRTVISPRHA